MSLSVFPSGVGKVSAWLIAVAIAAGLVEWPSSAAATLSEAPTGYRHHFWTKDHGLPDNRVKAIAQTTDGYLWIGTAAGLARFDGMTFTIFRSANLPELVSDNVTALAPDRDGSLWIGTTRNLVRYSTRGTQSWVIGRPGDEEIRGLSPAVGNGVWVATRFDIRLFQNGAWVHLPAVEHGGQPWVHGIAASSDGRLWTGYKTGLHQYDPRTGQRGPDLLTPQEPSDLQPARGVGALGSEPAVPEAGLKTLVYGLLPLGSDACWAYRAGPDAHFLMRWQDGQWASWEVPQPADLDGLPTPLFLDRAGNLWMSAGRHGLHRFRDGQFARYREANGLSDDWVLCGMEDREGNLWFGTFNGGLNRWQPQYVRAIVSVQGKPMSNTWAVIETQDAAVWIGTDDGLVRVREENLDRFTAHDGLAGSTVRALAEDAAGRLWIGLGGAGLSCWESNRFVSCRVPGDLSANKVRALCAGPNDTLWIGTEAGLHVLAGGPADSVVRVGEVPRCDVRALLCDGEQQLWIGTHGAGLWRWANNQLRVFTVADGLAADRVWALHQAGDGVLWIGTSQGISRLDGERMVSLTPPDGLFEPAVNSIIDDGHGRLWFGGDRGIYCHGIEDFLAAAEGR